MRELKKKKLIRRAQDLLGDEELTGALVEHIESQRGSLGFLLNTLKKRHRTFNPFVLKGMSVYHEAEALDRKTAELVAVASAAALRCEHCLDAHIGRAVQEGATMDEVLDTLLIAGAISESSTLSVALRKFTQQEGKLKRKPV